MVFYFSSSKVPFATSKYGVQYLSKKDVENTFYNSFYNVTGAIGGLQATVEQMTQTDFPIVIIGEAGTGGRGVAGLSIRRVRCTTIPWSSSISP